MKSAQERFLEQLPVESISARVAEQSGHDRNEISALMNTFSNESRITLDLVIDKLDPEKRMLEVGAGLCLLSLFLTQQGFRIVALEPALGGFGLFERLKAAILSELSHIDLTVLDKPAQNLNAKEDGPFDLIFSNNVIEHIPDWHDAMESMVEVLKPSGLMIHACPNYSIPYEPHYGVPVFRHFPSFSRKLFLPSGSDPEIWDSLNFITCNEIRNYCNKNNLSYLFRKELLFNAIKRIDEDTAFRERHKGLVATVASLIIRSGMGALIKRIPPALSTPLIVEIRKSQTGAK
ncbi:Methyltransferase domain-containing protein [Mariprofundus ferrinatatus]|uniref:Methyltransferase domain-containing protein n=1 Tax=Mariprofundus ferrinatatus TaxID=1921087 RepID=A0A2K8L482_9PROT|nr:class I SAM-dependent methyltransferase [Mariprofundus ferrinatatus]ATX82053.1 Methyltransferase domain-containing protein [Mariprofundus ferrinatatus]